MRRGVRAIARCATLLREHHGFVHVNALSTVPHVAASTSAEVNKGTIYMQIISSVCWLFYIISNILFV